MAERLGIVAESKGKIAGGKGEALNLKAAETEEENDARTLWVEFDDQGGRFQEWRKVVSDSLAHQGPASLLQMLKHLHRHGGCPRTWFQSWLRRHGVADTDRAAHKVRPLLEALWLGGCYDQLIMRAFRRSKPLGGGA